MRMSARAGGLDQRAQRRFVGLNPDFSQFPHTRLNRCLLGRAVDDIQAETEGHHGGRLLWTNEPENAQAQAGGRGRSCVPT